MSQSLRRMIALLAATILVGFVFAGGAFAQDEAEKPAEGDAEKTEEKAEEKTEPAEEAGLSEEQMDYVAISGTVACYNKRVSDSTKANAAIDAFLSSEGLTLDEYKGMEKKFRGDTTVQAAIKEEMALCDTKVLAMPEEETPDEELTDAEKKELEEADKDEKKWTYRKKVYKGTTSKGSVKGGRVVFAFKKNGKNAKGNVTGKLSGNSFALGLSGVRKKNSITLRGSSGKKNSATVKVTFKKAKTKDGYEHYSAGSGSFKGKINGKKVNFTFKVKSKK